MKKLLISLIAAATLFAQSTVISTTQFSVNAADPSITLSTTLDNAVAIANILMHTAISGTASSTRLVGACSSVATTCTLADVGGITVGNGLCFSSPCSAIATATGGPPPTSFTYSGGEIALITAVDTNTKIVTLQRHTLGTAAANMNSGQAVSVLVAGSYNQNAYNWLTAKIASVVQDCANGAYTTTTACAAISAATTAINTAH